MSSNWRLLLLTLGTSETNHRFGLIRPATTQLPVPFHHNWGRAPRFARTQCHSSVDGAQGSGRTTTARRMDQLLQLHAKTRCWRNHQRLELQGLSLWHVLREEDTLAPRRLFRWRPQPSGSCVCYPGGFQKRLVPPPGLPRRTNMQRALAVTTTAPTLVFRRSARSSPFRINTQWKTVSSFFFKS